MEYYFYLEQSLVSPCPHMSNNKQPLYFGVYYRQIMIYKQKPKTITINLSVLVEYFGAIITLSNSSNNA